jgi:pimeloyl-ACP methyl ester carboxylesterase
LRSFEHSPPSTLHTAQAGSGVQDVDTDAIWFGDAGRPQLGWLSRPAAGVGASGIVIAPPVGYEYWCSHRALRALAERLALAGHAVLRFDYDGTGDSSGDQCEPGRVAAWQRTLADAAAELIQLGAEHITLAGARLGGAFALLGGRELGAAKIIAWLPVTSGRRYAKELKLLSTPVPEDGDPAAQPGTIAVSGNVFSPETVKDLQELRIEALTEAPAPVTLIVDDTPAASMPLIEHLRTLGVEVDQVSVEGAEEALHTPPEFATVPEAVLSAICDWIGPDVTPDDRRTPVKATPKAEFEWRGGRVSESVLRLGGQGQVAVLTSPPGPVSHPTTLVLLNPGSETHVGPGRAWVEYARDLALSGRQTIRVDFLGWGESPDAGRAPGRPYDKCGEQDTVEIVRALQAEGFERLAICGLCASAWIALRAVLQTPVAGVIAFNPQLYWNRGDPVNIDWDLIRSLRAAEIRRVELGARYGLWSLIDAVGHRSRAARWLDDLAATGVPVKFVFAEGDDGLIYINGRLRRRAQRLQRGGRLSITELPGVDHPMHRTWMRPSVLAALTDALDEIDATG